MSAEHAGMAMVLAQPLQGRQGSGARQGAGQGGDDALKYLHAVQGALGEVQSHKSQTRQSTQRCEIKQRNKTRFEYSFTFQSKV